MKEKGTWTKRRHRIVTKIACAVLAPFCKWVYGADVKPFAEQGDRAYLILLNHTTAFDQFFVGISFSGPVYYIATEDIFSIGWVSTLLRWLVAPIPIKKGTVDVQAVKNCIRITREGGTICIAPEGNRTYSGKTEHMNPAIAGLAKKLKLPVALYRIEGGYGVQPRWSDAIRKGRMKAYVSEVIEPEEIESLTNEALYDRIQKGLYVNDANAEHVFYHPKRAEYLERAVYVCPYCGLSKFESHKEVVACMTCHRKIRYEPTTELTGVGFEFPFRFVNDWYEYQKDFVWKLDLKEYLDRPMFEDIADVSQVILGKRKKLLYKDAKLGLYGDRITIGQDLVLSYRDISAASALGRNKINLYHRDMVYQFKGGKRFNAMKYVNIFYCHKNREKGEENGEFLGL